MCQAMTFVGVAVACLFTALPSPAADEPDRKKEAEAIVKMVQDSQRAGIVNRNAKAFMSIWTKDARIIMGRSEKPGPHDCTMNRKAMEASHQLQVKAGPKKDTQMDFDDAQVTFTGQKARLTYRTYVSMPELLTITDEIFLLRKTKDGWRVYENRCWLVECHEGSDVIKYDRKKWKELDDRVTRCQKQGDLRLQTWALVEAYRFAEAYAASKKLTKAHPEDAQAWFWRGYTAMTAGHVEDAVASYKKSLALDETAPVPDYIREKPQPKKSE